MKNRFIRISVYVLTISFLSLLLLFKTLPNYMVYSQIPENGDVIIVTSGDGDGTRLEKGYDLYKRGFAPKIILTGGKFYKNETWARYKMKYLEGRMPTSDILLEEKSTSTLEEAQYTLKILNNNNFKTILFITNDYHSRRAFNVFRRVYRNSGIRIISCPAKSKEINIKKWWKDNYSSEVYFTEIIKTIWYMLRHGII